MTIGTSTPARHGAAGNTRTSSIERDIQLVEHASAFITELGADLDARLRSETRATEQLRFVRETTNRITRAANDAVQAYRRARRSLELQAGSSAPDAQDRLGRARSAMLEALHVAGRRYPSTKGVGPPSR